MDKYYLNYIENLNNDDVNIRLDSLRKLKEGIEKGDIARPVSGEDVNNHIHSIYSFSPYSPSKAIWMAYTAGLTTAGIMDHDSISGAYEFIEAGKIIGIATTIGVECRTDFSKTPLNGRRINNPDQKSVAYVALHGIPHTEIDKVKEFFKPYLAERNKRNRLMVDRINDIFNQYGVTIDFDADVVPLSKSAEQGSITERHILYALSLRLIEVFGKGNRLVDFLKNELKLNLSSKVENYLLDGNNEHYAYDLLGALKSDLVEKFYIDATAECPDIKEVINFAREIGAISAYAYLGDVGNSVTGDKKSQKFEDDYLDELFDVIKEIGFNAVTYMPSRNTMEQLKRLKQLCEKYGMFQISGEDINTPRQSFICTALRNEEFRNLIDSTWALIGHEYMATQDKSKGLFSDETIARYPDLNERIKEYCRIGREIAGNK
ncbi:MAG TPA: PHP domain-containing protein [Clostridiaceae bacterium]|nr:PHP domain-containing protein [Clostridiaceae bacterium]